MLIFIVGGSAGGKSEYAGRIAEKLSDGKTIRYIATMPEQGKEAEAKIRRHEQLRQNGEYQVSLCLSFSDLDQVINEISMYPDEITPLQKDQTSGAAAGQVVLLDSLDGFLAGVLFSESEVQHGSGQGGLSEPAADDSENRMEVLPVETRLNELLEQLERRVGHLILVSDDFYRDGTEYDAQTEKFIDTAGRICRRICKRADAVIEVICGIPVLLHSEGRAAVKMAQDTERLERAGTGGKWYEFFEIPYHDDIHLYPDPHAGA